MSDFTKEEIEAAIETEPSRYDLQRSFDGLSCWMEATADGDWVAWPDVKRLGEMLARAEAALTRALSERDIQYAANAEYAAREARMEMKLREADSLISRAIAVFVMDIDGEPQNTRNLLSQWLSNRAKESL